MGRPLWFVSLLKKTFPGRFLLARLTRLPLAGALVERSLFAGDDLLYIPQDRVIAINHDLGAGPQTVLPSQVVEHFVRKARHHWIMNACICRESAGCRGYPHDLGCLFLGEAVQGINPRLGRLVSREEALSHVRRCAEAGLVHLIGRNKLDTVWLGIGPGERLLTICHCCPCCCLWRILPYLKGEIGATVARMPGVRVQVTERCTACGACTRDVCFVQAIRLEDKRAVIGEACRGCGRCAAVCPQRAIEISYDGASAAATIARLSALVDVT
ncbi:MAG: DUF362 domain-containing protein [Anaerolineae bacterium]